MEDKPSREEFLRQQLGEDGFRLLQKRLRTHRMLAIKRVLAVMLFVIILGYWLTP